MSIEQQIFGALDALFSSPNIADNERSHLSLIHTEAKKMPHGQKARISDTLLEHSLPPDNEIPLLFFLYDCFDDIRFLEATIPLMPESPSVPWFYEFYWNMSKRLFTRSSGGEKIHIALRERFYRVAQKARSFLQSRGLISRAFNFKPPKRIAIIVPQILNMRHSPTREAFNIALHLDHYHDCETYILNTNAMNYANCDQLNLLMKSLFQTNEVLAGQNKVPVEYMQFKSSVNTISFEAGPMSTQKIAQIANVLQQLNIEAVIAHGENLLVMESLHGFYPSLFATTGSVVPFNHCDAYFVPEQLFDDRAKSIADKYNHENFMMENMLVTPQGQAEFAAEREKFNLAEDDFLFLVVGTRMSDELNDEFCDVCNRLLESNPHAKILFAGTPSLDLARHFDERLIAQRKVINIGFQEDLPSVSAMCDVFLNPKRAGGGTSSQTAMLNGLPVVTLNFGHISAIVPENKRHTDWDAYFDYANTLQRNSDFLIHEGQASKQHFIDNLDSASQIARMYEKLVEVARTYS